MDFNKIFDLTGKTALVTGSSRGIGRDIALTLAGAGAHVIIHGHKNSDKLKQTVVEAENTGAKAVGIAADISVSEEISYLIEQSQKVFGGIDILILNASMEVFQPLDEFTVEAFEKVFSTNLKSSFELISQVSKGMKQQKWGRILSLGSVNQWKQSPNLPVYASSKAAQVNLIMNCARQFAPFGITVNNIAPGVIPTERNKTQLAVPEYREKLEKMIPCGQLGKTENCSTLALLLCSESGNYITGADIPVTGGMHL